MAKIKEKVKSDKSKSGKSRFQPALTQQQAAKLLRDKYIQQLDQRPEGSEGQAEYATEQIEAAEHFATDELARPRSPRQRTQPIKEKSTNMFKEKGKPERPNPPDPAPSQKAPTPQEDSTAPREQTTNPPKERATQSVKACSTAKRVQTDPPVPQKTQQTSSSPQPAQRAARLKERPAVKIKEAGSRTDAPLIKDRSSLNIHRIHPSIESSPTPPETPGKPVQPAPAQRMMENAKRRLSTSRQATPTASGATTNTGTPGPGRQPPKVRTSAKGSAPKVRGKVYPKGASAPKAARDPFKAAVRPLRSVKQTARQRMTQQAVRQTAKQAGAAAEKAALMLKRAVQAVAKATVALVSSLVALAGGGILLIALVVVIVIGAVASSPFGLFFSAERNAPDTVSTAEAVATVNMAYNAKLEEVQAGDYDDIDITGQPPDWADVLAVFAVKVAGADVDGMDVATLDPDRVSRLTAVFWDMTSISTVTESIDHPDSDPDDDVDDSWTEHLLHITVTAKTADDMRLFYAFSGYQNSALDELLSDRAALSSLAGSLQITAADAVAVLEALPDDLSRTRREVVETALQLYGKENYFWGGKSRVIGWDSRWGQTMKVTAEGSKTTGTYRPFGLDCSGFVDWVFCNASGGSYIIGHGGGAASQHTYCTTITWAEAQPGDLVFYPGDEHVGIVCGRDASGGLLVIHCASAYNNVVITGISGFTSVGRPVYYSK